MSSPLLARPVTGTDTLGARPDRVRKFDCEVVVVGGGIAGLSAAWRLRERDMLLLEAAPAVGGRIRSEPRGSYWLNLGPHVLPPPTTNLGRLLDELGLETALIPGTATAAFVNGKLVAGGRPETFPFRLRLPLAARLSLAKAGIKIRSAVREYLDLAVRQHGETPAAVRQRLLAYRDETTFAEFLGTLHPDVEGLLRAAINRVSAEPEELAAGAGVGQFAATFNGDNNLYHRNLPGGTGVLVERLASRLVGSIMAATRVTSVRNAADAVVIKATAGNEEELEVRARVAIVATPAFVSLDIIDQLPADLRAALGQIRYGPYVVAGLLTREQTAMPWDRVYALVVARKSFNMFFNTASLLRAASQRLPGGSVTVYGAAGRGKDLLGLPDEAVVSRFATDLNSVFPQLRNLIEEVVIQRWPNGIPFAAPGRGAHQACLETPVGRVILAGDYLGERGGLDTAATSGIEAAENALKMLQSGAPQLQEAVRLGAGPTDATDRPPNHRRT
jgi:protoporphyrinogen/coproporphyrinogen III oxidase